MKHKVAAAVVPTLLLVFLLCDTLILGAAACGHRDLVQQVTRPR